MTYFTLIAGASVLFLHLQVQNDRENQWKVEEGSVGSAALPVYIPNPKSNGAAVKQNQKVTFTHLSSSPFSLDDNPLGRTVACLAHYAMKFATVSTQEGKGGVTSPFHVTCVGGRE